MLACAGGVSEGEREFLINLIVLVFFRLFKMFTFFGFFIFNRYYIGLKDSYCFI